MVIVSLIMPIAEASLLTLPCFCSWFTMLTFRGRGQHHSRSVREIHNITHRRCQTPGMLVGDVRMEMQGWINLLCDVIWH